jgi:hypothetical protein
MFLLKFGFYSNIFYGEKEPSFLGFYFPLPLHSINPVRGLYEKFCFFIDLLIFIVELNEINTRIYDILGKPQIVLIKSHAYMKTSGPVTIY